MLLMLGDCLEKMAEIPDGSVDMILADLPYGTTACKWDSVIPFEPLWAHYKRVTKKNAAIVLTASQPFTSALVMSCRECFRYEWVWRKNQGVNPMAAKIQPLRNHENICIFYQRAPTYNPQMWGSFPYSSFSSSNGKKIGEVYGGCKSKHRDNTDGTRYPLTVLDVKMEKGGKHPTQKPVALMEYLIRTYTNEGETVLDNCAGSFTTAIACINTGRKFIGIERDAGYFDVGLRRVQKRLESSSSFQGADVHVSYGMTDTCISDSPICSPRLAS